MLNAELAVTKLNKSAEVLLNTSAAVTVGKKITEIFTTDNAHLMKPVSEVSQSKPYTCLLKTQISTTRGSSEAKPPTETSEKIKVPINFHVTKLSNPEKKLHALCLVLQPVIVQR